MKRKNIELEKLEQFKNHQRQKLREEIEQLIQGIEGKVEKAAMEKLKDDLRKAIQQNNPEKIKTLVEIKADPNWMFDNDAGGSRGRKETALSYAISCTVPEAIKSLIEAKADPNQKTPAFELWYKHWDGLSGTLQHTYPSQTPLEYAIEHDVFRHMSDDEYKKQPVQVVLGSGARRDVFSQQNIIDILLKEGAEVTTVARKSAADDGDLFSFMLKKDYLDSKRISAMKSTFTFFWDNMEKKSGEGGIKQKEMPAVKMIEPLADLIGSYISKP